MKEINWKNNKNLEIASVNRIWVESKKNLSLTRNIERVNVRHCKWYEQIFHEVLTFIQVSVMPHPYWCVIWKKSLIQGTLDKRSLKWPWNFVLYNNGSLKSTLSKMRTKIKTAKLLQYSRFLLFSACFTPDSTTIQYDYHIITGE